MAIDPVAVIRAMREVPRKDVDIMFRRSDFLALVERIRERLGLVRIRKSDKNELAAYIVLLYTGPESIRDANEKDLAATLGKLFERIRRHHAAAVKACRERLASSWVEERKLRGALAHARKKGLRCGGSGPAAAKTKKEIRKIEKDLRKVTMGIAWTEDRLDDPITLMAEVVLAYMNGWKRQKGFQPGKEGWEGAPTRARAVLMTYMRNTVLTAMEWFRTNTEVPIPDDKALDHRFPDQIINRVATGTCRCPERLKEFDPHVDHKDNNYEQRLAKCLRQHRLIAWQPEEENLWAFVGRAVTGALGKRIDRGLLDGGMFWDRLDAFLRKLTRPRRARARIYLGSVAQWVCPHCGQRTVSSRCYRKGSPECERAPPFDARTTKRVITRFWIVDRLRYVQRFAVVCWGKDCGTFYPIDRHDVCPRCGRSHYKPPAKKSGKIDRRGHRPRTRVWFPLPGYEIHEIQFHDFNR